MRHVRRFTSAMGAVLLVCAVFPARAAEDSEMVDNPYYRNWASFKVGAQAVHNEKTVHGDGSIEEKKVQYQLAQVADKNVVVRTFVIERELLSTIETAPTRIIYPAKVKKADLEAALIAFGAKRGKDTIKVLGKEMEVNTIEITKKQKNEEVKVKIWHTPKIPGGIVKKVQTTSEDGKEVATTTTTLASYRVAPKKESKKEE
jgi:hypothetical protein